MAATNPLNVFKGSDSLAQYFDPDNAPPVPLVELPDSLNPLRADGVRIYAKMLTALPAQNVKSLPALNMLHTADDSIHDQQIVEASSGSTILSLGMLSRGLWGHENTVAYVTNKSRRSQLDMLRFFGIKCMLYGGISQQNPMDPRGIVQRLQRLEAESSDVYNCKQYHSEKNWESHVRWTGPQIWKQLPEITLFCSTVGTAGCIVGVGKYLKPLKPSVKVLGVYNVQGDHTPGPRARTGFEHNPFPWQGIIDDYQEVKSVDAYRASMELSRHGIIAGPSSGQALHGLIAHVKEMKAAGRLNELVDAETKEIHCAFVCADLPYQYIDGYHAKLPESEFPTISDQHLLNCDQDYYDKAWFLIPEHAMAFFSKHNVTSPLFCPSPSKNSLCQECHCGSHVPNGDSSDSDALTLIDFRPKAAFDQGHIKGSKSLPLSETIDDFFGDSYAVEKRWLELSDLLAREPWLLEKTPGPVLIVCTEGDTGRMAASMLRARGREAFSLEGGFEAITAYERGERRVYFR
ncbi:hypothetical protein N7456_003363 [Penicillium angulare]|uniref:Rhodanese domain-containing protein n=1 Tax=Penicillium angulare TaxID=116970 RepID=A0A9W9FUN2_9EURO|nr:hypothetical protein N7456_003363 [Penicillium angulare]